tara:strand:- start:880 stop:1293 length:414 start_codon:yes stop_codon:yes gene_type:complete
MRKFAYLILSIILLISCQDSGPVESENPNIILITLDGVRWQEVFNGIDTNLLNNKKFTKNVSMLENMFVSEDDNIRQQKLVPFLGTFISNNGILIGNKNEGSNIKLTNDQLFSYPGYNEILTGSPDSSITSNDKIYK